jgi:DNA-binding MarR family transcriptional regulator
MPNRRQQSAADTEALLEALLAAARTIDNVLTRRAPEAVGERLTRSKSQVLLLLGARVNPTSSQLAYYLGVTKPAVTQIISSLVDSGLVKRETSSRDRRGFRIRLTPKGARLRKKLVAEQRHLVLSAFSRSRGRHRAVWTEALREIARAIAQADSAFSRFCHDCGAHEDGSCVLTGGRATCRFLKAQKEMWAKRRTRTKSAATTRATRATGSKRAHRPHAKP